MLSSCFRSIFAKIAILIWLIVAVDQVFRHQVVLTPSEVAEKYMAVLVPSIDTNQKEMSLKERSKFVQEQCNKSKTFEYDKKRQDNYFYIKSKKSHVNNVLLCIPQRMASKAAFDVLNGVFDYPCYKGSKGKLRNCAVGEGFKPENKTLKVVFTRHPFDRLIIEFRHQKSIQNEVKPSNRKLLFSRHRNGWKKKGGKKGSHQFREFIISSVLGANSTVWPVSQVCNVCNQNYDIVYNLDDGLEHIEEVLEMAGSDTKYSPAAGKLKVVGAKVQQKFFSEITADEMELLYNKFKDDFLLFGYVSL